MNYEEWMESVPEVMRADSLWKVQAYRIALFLSDLSWADTARLVRDQRTTGPSDQLYRAVGSIGANLAEGYSRGTGRDRAHFYEYALGSAREARDWYYKGRHILGEAVTDHRLQLASEIIRLLLTMIPQQRQRSMREESTSYDAGADVSPSTLAHLLDIVPLPDP